MFSDGTGNITFQTSAYAQAPQRAFVLPPDIDHEIDAILHPSRPKRTHAQMQEFTSHLFLDIRKSLSHPNDFRWLMTQTVLNKLTVDIRQLPNLKHILSQLRNLQTLNVNLSSPFPKAFAQALHPKIQQLETTQSKFCTFQNNNLAVFVETLQRADCRAFTRKRTHDEI